MRFVQLDELFFRKRGLGNKEKLVLMISYGFYPQVRKKEAGLSGINSMEYDKIIKKLKKKGLLDLYGEVSIWGAGIAQDVISDVGGGKRITPKEALRRLSVKK